MTLKSYNVTVQQYATWFSGFKWQVYGCGTFRHSVNSEGAEASLRVFLRRLGRLVGNSPIACLAVLEGRMSGCASTGTELHWHFVMAGPLQHRLTLLQGARRLWARHYGNAKVEGYNPDCHAATYLAKTAALGELNYVVHNLERLTYCGPTDITAHLKNDAYVPAHARPMIHGKTLRLARETPNTAIKA